MHWSVKLFAAILYGVIGAVGAGICAWIFITIWTAIFVRVPLDRVWDYGQEEPGYGVFAAGFVCVGVLVGLVAGVVKGIRYK